MRIDNITYEERVIKAELTQLNPHAARQPAGAITHPECQRRAEVIFHAEVRLPTIAALPLIGDDEFPVENATVGIRQPEVHIRRNRLFVSCKWRVPRQRRL